MTCFCRFCQSPLNDHVIDLGPTGGYGGGKILAIGKPEDITKNKKSSLYKRLFANSLYQTKQII